MDNCYFKKKFKNTKKQLNKLTEAFEFEKSKYKDNIRPIFIMTHLDIEMFWINFKLTLIQNNAIDVRLSELNNNKLKYESEIGINKAYLIPSKEGYDVKIVFSNPINKGYMSLINFDIELSFSDIRFNRYKQIIKFVDNKLTFGIPDETK